MSSTKPILTISVAAEMLGLHPRTLMLYEKAGFITPERTSTKRRLFSMKDIEDLQFLKFLTHNLGINLAGVKCLLEAINLAQKQGFELKKELFPNFKYQAVI